MHFVHASVTPEDAHRCEFSIEGRSFSLQDSPTGSNLSQSTTDDHKLNT